MTTESKNDGFPPAPFDDQGRRHQDFERLPQASFDYLNIGWLQAHPEVRAKMPPLRDALEMWFTTDDYYLLQLRASAMFTRCHTSPRFLMLLYSYIKGVPQADGTERPYMIIDHAPAMSAADNIAAMEEHRAAISQTLGVDDLPPVLKTVTVAFNDPRSWKRHVLVSGVGDFRLDKGLKREIGAELGLPGQIAKDAVINPREFDTTLVLGMQPGMVKPMVEEHLVGNISGVCYLKGLSQPDSFVAITVSPLDSIIVRVSDFEEAFSEYGRRFYPHLELRQKEGYDIYVLPDELRIFSEHLQS